MENKEFFFPVSQANPQGSPNLNLYDPKTGNVVKSFIYKKQIDW